MYHSPHAHTHTSEPSETSETSETSESTAHASSAIASSKRSISSFDALIEF